MLISKQKFAAALADASKGLSNYDQNLRFNAGRWRCWPIHKCTIDGHVFYCSTCPGVKHANTDVTQIKQTISRYWY